MGNMLELCVIDQTGDTKSIWDPSKKDEVEVAEDTFNKLKKKGYAIYSVKKNGDQGKIMHKFDPDAGRMIAVPPVVGG